MRRAGRAHADQPGVLQLREVVRDRGRLDGEQGGELGDAPFLSGDEPEDRQTTLVGKGLEYPELRAGGGFICYVDIHQFR